MWSKIWKPICSKLSTVCQPRKNMAINRENCGFCLEENRMCRCGNGIENLRIDMVGLDNEPQVKAQPDSSYAHAVINMVGMLIGLGQLSTPYALETGGWISIFLLLGLGMLCSYTAHLLGKCLDKHPNSESYTDIGDNAFGSKGKMVAAAFIYLEIFMALVSYTISLHDNLIQVFKVIGRAQLNPPLMTELSSSQALTAIAVLVALPSLWLRDLSSISFLSFGGILMSIVIFVSVASTAVFGGVEANHKIEALNLKNIPAMSGLYVFSFAGHIVFPNLYKAMKDPSKFTKVTIVSFSFVTILYTALAFMGATLFGPQISPQITLSMPPHLIVTKIALCATVLTPMTKYALEFAPLAVQLEHSLPDSMSSKAKIIIRSGVGSVLLLIILALALCVPYFEHVLSLTGSLVSIGISVVFPCAFYVKICWDKLSRPSLIINSAFIALGLLLGAVGTISSSKLLVESLQRSH